MLRLYAHLIGTAATCVPNASCSAMRRRSSVAFDNGGRNSVTPVTLLQVAIPQYGVNTQAAAVDRALSRLTNQVLPKQSIASLSVASYGKLSIQTCACDGTPCVEDSTAVRAVHPRERSRTRCGPRAMPGLTTSRVQNGFGAKRLRVSREHLLACAARATRRAAISSSDPASQAKSWSDRRRRGALQQCSSRHPAIRQAASADSSMTMTLTRRPDGSDLSRLRT